MDYSIIKKYVETKLGIYETTFKTFEFSPSTIKHEFDEMIRDIEGLYNLSMIDVDQWKELHEMVFPVMMRLGIEVN